MVSGLAWLDGSRDEQRRVRELLKLFEQPESRDELGVGQIRDVFSDRLFPGTSVLHTRARYLLVVPWCDLAGRPGESASNERRFIKTMRDAGKTDGLIGSRTGPAVKTLPSVIYRSALDRFGISTGASRLTSAVKGDAGELVEQAVGPWHSELPLPPKGFPRVVEGGFALTRLEAEWLRDRIITTCEDSLLADLLRRRARIAEKSEAPWADPACWELPNELARVLRHAQMFANAMHGALLLYNLLVARKYETAGYNEVRDKVADYTDRMTGWINNYHVPHWDVDDMWATVRLNNPRISPVTVAFVDRWITACRSPRSIPDDMDLHQLIERREISHKKAQARLARDEMLRRWTGASGVQLMNYRWGQIRRLVNDINSGLEDASAAA
jgi:hypothetical protein